MRGGRQTYRSGRVEFEELRGIDELFDEAQFQLALAQSRLRGQVPPYLNSNRAQPTKVIQEPELQAMTKQWFVDCERKLASYRDRGIELGWLIEWSKKYWWSFLVRDMDLNVEFYAADLRYHDPSTLGATIVGIDDFVTYNFAFFDAIPDWRYDPLPNQVYVDITPEGTARMVVRYIGSGHWTGPLKFHPYDESAPALYGNGQFLQCPAVDRYHFNDDGLMEEGETLFDLLDGLQRLGAVPRGDSWQFRAISAASRATATYQKARCRVAGLRGRR